MLLTVVVSSGNTKETGVFELNACVAVGAIAVLLAMPVPRVKDLILLVTPAEFGIVDEPGSTANAGTWPT